MRCSLNLWAPKHSSTLSCCAHLRRRLLDWQTNAIFILTDIYRAGLNGCAYRGWRNEPHFTARYLLVYHPLLFLFVAYAAKRSMSFCRDETSVVSLSLHKFQESPSSLQHSTNPKLISYIIVSSLTFLIFLIIYYFFLPSLVIKGGEMTFGCC